METKKVVLVEDERLILKGLERLFKWEEYGFSVVFSTTSPVEAYEYICTHGTDVLFTDIKMREMTGLELISKLKENGAEPLCVVISGYDSYSYMRSSMRLRVFDYCLKPLSNEDAEEVLKNLRTYFDDKKEEIEDEGNIRLGEIIEYIDQNFDTKISLKELSERFFFNMNYLSYALKKELGMTLTEYLKKIRMEKARSLIREGKTTTETAITVGIMDYAQFHKMYKKYWGLTPKEDRENNEDI